MSRGRAYVHSLPLALRGEAAENKSRKHTYDRNYIQATLEQAPAALQISVWTRVHGLFP